ncbi:MAG: radical SAM protein, partial [Treponema sp.]|nr:radical SAM protein [Treponema sp.]
MASFYIKTLGCKLNQLESESIIDAFMNAGFINSEMAGAALSPSVIVINTCTVTSKADQKARRVIRKAMHENPDACVIVTGCYAKLNKEDILRLGTDNRHRLVVIDKEKIIKLPQYLYDKIKEGNDLNDLCVSASPIMREYDKNDLFAFNPQQFSRHTRSFLKIQDGCDKSCTYCKIRLARGPSVSLEKDEVLSRLRLLEQTHAEAVLTGVSICQYGEQRTNDRDESKGSGLVKLLDYLLSGTKKIAIRLSSLSPENIDKDLCRILSHPRIQPHFHLSVQSCSNIILQKMGRLYNAETVERAVSLLRGIKDDPFLACDIITGFPCETKIEFE